MKELQTHPDLKATVGFAGGGTLPGKFAEFQIGSYTITDYLSNMARSRVALYVRGLHHCLSFKFGQMLALGMPIVGQTIHNNHAALSRNKFFGSQFAFDDPKEIVREAVKLLDQPEKLKELGESNASLFDTKFAPQPVVADILNHLGFKRRVDQGRLE